MPKMIIVLFALALLFLHCKAAIFTRCELVEELKRNDFPTEKLRHWVCLIEAESGGNTAVISALNSNGSRDWGLFQINDKIWCSRTKTPGKDCNVSCGALITDDITKAADCAKVIYRRHKFNAWFGWISKCRGKTLPDISRC